MSKEHDSVADIKKYMKGEITYEEFQKSLERSRLQGIKMKFVYKKNKPPYNKKERKNEV